MTVFHSWDKRIGDAAVFDMSSQMSNREVTLPDDIVYDLVDAGFETTVFLFKNGRYECRVDDWIDEWSTKNKRTMKLSRMDRV